ncbi:MAG: hypothetical protein IPN71_15875 [Fibrobacteres bacterium]|nr:hypothetical protein [Fibrobacterota bacterium]
MKAPTHEVPPTPHGKAKADEHSSHAAPKAASHKSKSDTHEAVADSLHPPSPTSHTKEPQASGHHVQKLESKAPKVRDGLCGPLPRKKTTWTRRDGVLRLRGTVVVGTDQTLSIGPGVEVQVSSRDACPDSGARDGTSILVLAGGSLAISGNSKAPVRFAPDSASPKGLSWGGLRLEKTSPSQASIRWTEINHARTAVTFLGGEGEIAHLVAARCGVGVAVLGGGAPTIRHSVFHHTVLADVVSKKSSPHLWGNLFHESQTDAIRFDGVGLARLEGNSFYGQRQNAIVRGPAGSGGWTSDTLPDRFGNWRRDPILRTSDSAQRLMKARQRGLDSAAWWVPRRPLPEPPGDGPWALSAHSPLLDKGPRLCKDVDGSTCDIGLFGGK